MTAALPVAAAAALALAGTLGDTALTVAVVLVQAALLLGWVRAGQLPATPAAAVVAGGMAVTADVLMLTRTDEPLLAPLVGLLAAAVLVGLLRQLGRLAPRDQLTESLASGTTVAVLVLAAALWVASAVGRGGADIVLAGSLALGAAAVAGALPLPDAARVPLGVGLATLVGVVVGQAEPGLGAGSGAAVAVACALTGLLGVAVGRLVAAPERVPALLAGALPVAFAGPAAYVVGRIVVG